MDDDNIAVFCVDSFEGFEDDVLFCLRCCRFFAASWKGSKFVGKSESQPTKWSECSLVVVAGYTVVCGTVLTANDLFESVSITGMDTGMPK